MRILALVAFCFSIALPSIFAQEETVEASSSPLFPFLDQKKNEDFNYGKFC